MKYRILLAHDGGENLTFTEIAQVNTESPNPSLEQLFSAEIFATVSRVVEQQASLPDGAPIFARHGLLRGRAAKPIYILSIEDPNTAPSGIRVGGTVSSSRELSLLLGYNYNMVLQQFARARQMRIVAASKIEDPELKDAKLREPLEGKLRGITFAYLEDVGKA